MCLSPFIHVIVNSFEQVVLYLPERQVVRGKVHVKQPGGLVDREQGFVVHILEHGTNLLLNISDGS